MIVGLNFSVRPASGNDRQQLANLIHFERTVHRHLDWRSPLDWIDNQPFLVAEKGNLVVAALACPADPPGIAWVRLFAVSAEMPIQDTWVALWEKAKEELIAQRNRKVVAISLQNWFERVLENCGFTHKHDVVMMAWQRDFALETAMSSPVAIRMMTPEDIDAVRVIDAAAFSLVWQNSKESLELALSQAYLATVAEDEGEIAGYTICTQSHMNVHLARLAVHPNAQGRDIGYALVYDLLLKLNDRGVTQITVNTQGDNAIAKALYQKAGFTFTGETYKVFEYECA